MAFKHVILQLIIIAIELLPLILKLIAGSSILLILFAAERAQASADLRAKTAEINADASFAEIEHAARVQATALLAQDLNASGFSARAKAEFDAAAVKSKIELRFAQEHAQTDAEFRRDTGRGDALMGLIQRFRAQLDALRAQNDSVFGKPLEPELRQAQAEDFQVFRDQVLRNRG